MSRAKCRDCGRRLDEHDRHLRFGLPEPVLAVPSTERAARTWGNDVMMQVDGVGAFVRILVPVHLTGQHKVTFGAWLGVHPDDLRRSYETWLTPEYGQLTLTGHLANMLPPWEEETFVKPLDAAVRDPEAVPYAIASSDGMMQRILREEWPHELVLAAVAPYESR